MICSRSMTRALAIVFVFAGAGIGCDARQVSQQEETTPRSQPAESDMVRIRITAGEFTFDALAAGPEDGPLVLMLHGFPQSSLEWRHQIPVLSVRASLPGPLSPRPLMVLSVPGLPHSTESESVQRCST